MPQSRFVLGRALALGHRVIVIVNKIDRPTSVSTRLWTKSWSSSSTWTPPMTSWTPHALLLRGQGTASYSPMRRART
jgi:GTP-binding protein